MTDPSATQGALGAYDATSGANVAIVTYDLALASSVTPSQKLTNTASLTNYASTPGGADFLASPLTDTADVTVVTPSVTKTLVSTSIDKGVGSDNDKTHAVIGEKATYTVTVTVPQGTSPSAVIADTLANGLAFVQLVSVTSNNGALTSDKGAFSNTALFTPTILDAGAAHQLSFDFGTLTDTDNNPLTNETLTITYEAVVLNVSGNTTGTTLSNSAAYSWKDAGNVGHSTAPASAQNVTVIEPKPTVTKVADKTTPQANDTVTYTITIDNSAAGSTDAHHVALSDPIPVGETLVAGSFAIVSNTSGSTPTLVEGSTLTASIADFAFGGKLVLTYQVKINQAVQPGQSLTNTADVQWTSLPTLTAVTPNNTNSVPRGGPNSGIVGGQLNNYETTGSATIKVPVGLTKALVTTSESLTGGNNLTIGEIARFRLTVALPTSTSPNFQILDKLPKGLTFLNDGTATLAFISGSSGGAFVAGTSPDGIYASNPSLQGSGYYFSTLPANGPTAAIPGALLSGGTGSGGTFLDGDDPVLSLGTLTNTQNDGSTQYVVVEFNAILDNSVAGNNKAGVADRTNVFDVKVNGSQVGVDSNGVSVHVVEPKITNLTKTVTGGTHDAGDVVTYTVTYSNTGTATAYDVKLSDTLPASLTLDGASLTVTTTGTGITTSTTGNALSVTIGRLDAGAGVTVTYKATLVAGVRAGQSIQNAATLTYASLPGTNGTTGNPTGSDSGSSGTDGGGRDGSGTNALDIYKGATSVTFAIPAPAVDKHLVSGNQSNVALPNVVVGETVTYDIVVTLPEGTTRGLSVTDAMPAGLLFQGYTVITSAAASHGYLAADYGGGALPSSSHSVVAGKDVFTFGDTDNVFDNVTNNNSFVIEVTALVQNVPSNVSGKTLQNGSSLTYTNGTTGNPTTVNGPTKPTITVVTPVLALTKTLSTATGDAGDSVTVTLTLKNTGTGPAYDVVISDPLTVAKMIGAAAVSAPAGFAFAYDAPTNTVSYTASAGTSVAAGATLTFTFTTTLTAAVVAGDTLTNTATVTQAETTDTLPVGDPNNRDVSGANGSAVLNVPAPTVDKHLIAGSLTSLALPNVTIGETVTYDIVVTLPEGFTKGLSVIDAMPAGLLYQGYTIITSAAASHGYLAADYGGGALPSSSHSVAAGKDVFTFGDTDNAFDDTANNNSFVLEVTALVTNIGTNVAGKTLQNTSSLTYTNGTTGNPTTIIGPTKPTITVVEPSLTVVKTLVTSGKDATDAVVYDITITNASGANVSTAYDVRVSDALDAALQLLSPGTDVVIQTNPGYVTVAGNTSTASQIDLALNQLNPGDSVTLRITAHLKPTALPATTVHNHVDVVYTSLPGTDPNERTGGGGINDYATSADASAFTVFSNSLTGQVFYDTNDDGVLNGSDTGIQSVNVTLTGFDFLGNVVNLTIPTDAIGNYRFDDLRPSDGTGYTITETQPGVYLDGKDSRPTSFTGAVGAGSSTGVQGNDVVSAILIGRGSNLVGPNYTFGEVFPSSISGTVYRDDDNNGQIDAGEPRLANVSVRLTGTDSQGNPVDVTIAADNSGNYSFTNLEPSDAAGYTVTEGATPGLLDGTDTIGPVGGTTGNDSFTIVLPQNTIAPANDFGELPPSSLAGTVFRDDNNNGVQDGTEPGIAGVTVTLTGTNDLGVLVPLTAITDGSGAFEFIDLRPGSYTVTETQPSQYGDGKDTLGSQGGLLGNDVVSNVSLVAGIDATGYTFGELGTALSGKVFLDRDRDGTVTVGDGNLGGVTIQLYDSLNSLVGTTTTLPDGTYSFANLPAGNYRVVETQPNGYGSSTPNFRAVSVPTTGLTNIDFGETLSSLAGTVYVDRDGTNSLTGADLRLGGVTVTLTGTDANGTGVSASTTTLADGTYSFTDLLSGNYTVTETQPAVWNEGADTLGSLGGTLRQDITGNIGVVQGVDGVSYDFGERGSAISGFAYYDKNRDATFGATEVPLLGVTITLRDSLGNTIGTQLTDGNGFYAFSNLPTGDYSITESQPTGYGSSTPDVVAKTLPLAGLTNQDFGDTKTSLSGRVYLDQNQNDARDTTEPGIGGVTVTLAGTTVNEQPVTLTTTTAADGTYHFDELLAGNYSITETQPARYNDGAETVGTSGGTSLVDDVFSNIDLMPDLPGIDYDFGEVGTTLSGKVFVDHNRDGVAQRGEAGLGGVSIDLYEGNVRIATTKTKADGTYAFLNLPTGNYRVVETQPIAYGSSTPNSSNVTLPLTGKTNVNFGETTGGVSGSVWIDSNNDGVRESDEVGIANTLITLTGTDVLGHPVSKSVQTDPQGFYSFTDLLKGTYRLARADLPPGFFPGTNHLGSLGGSTAVDVFGTALPGGVFGTQYDFAAIPIPSFDPGVAQAVIRIPPLLAFAPSTSAIVPAAGFIDPLFGFGPSQSRPDRFIDTFGTSDVTVEQGVARLAGFVYHDRNSNGVPDETEEGIFGVPVTLSGVTAKGRSFSRVTTTDDSGAYSFDQLPPGSYSVYRTLPEGFLDSKHGIGMVNGAASGEVSPSNFSRIVLQDGNTGLDYNFAEVQAAALRGVVWVANEELDEEGNMLSVVGKGGVTVLLTGKDDRGGVVRRVVKSDAEGHYAFERIYPGEYAVRVSTPRGFRAVEAQAGNKGGTAQEKKQIDRIRLKAGDRGTEYEFYQEGTGEINGRVGTTDVEVVLTGTDREGRTVERKTTTDAKGNYLFSALPPGKYRVEVKADPGKETGTKSPARVPASDAVAVEEITLGADGRATGPDFTPSGGDE